MNKIQYSIMGAGWRAEFYLRLAKICPDFFGVTCIMVRNESRISEIAEKYDVKIVKTLEELKQNAGEFIVNCINKDDIADMAITLSNDGFAVLCETPGCTGKTHAEQILSKLKKGLKIQVAEQFHLKPMYAAIKKIIDLRIIGDVNFASVSVAHEYHAMSLIKFFLGEKDVTLLSENEFNSPVLHTHFRDGETDNKQCQNSKHVIKVFKCGEKVGVYDFDFEQYFSPVRSDRLLIRGTRGEICENRVRYFNDDNILCESIIHRQKSGELDGLFSQSVTFEGRELYKNPFGTCRLTDEETAIGSVLLKMHDYVNFGNEFYSLKDAVCDVVDFEMENSDTVH